MNQSADSLQNSFANPAQVTYFDRGGGNTVSGKEPVPSAGSTHVTSQRLLHLLR